MPLSNALCLFLLGLLLSSPSRAQFQDAETTKFTRAEQYYNHGMLLTDRVEKARYLNYATKLLKTYLRKYPRGANSPAAYHYMGRSQEALGNIDDAKRTYRLMISKYRRGNYVGLSSLQMAGLTFTDENWHDAVDYFRLAATEISSVEIRQEALTKQAECLLKTRRKEETLAALAAVIQSPAHPHVFWARFMLGYQYYQDEQFQLTINTLKPLLKEGILHDYRAQAKFYTGLASTELGQTEDGEDYLRQVLALEVSKPDLNAEQRRQISYHKSLAQTALMKLHERKGNFAEVLKIFGLGDFGARGKTESRRSMTAGNAFYHFKRFNAARSSFRRVDRSAPNTPIAFDAAFKTLLCDYQLKQAALPDRVDTFLELYQNNFSNHEHIHMARFLKAETLYALEKFEKSANTFTQINAKMITGARRSDLFYKSGWCFAEMGDHNGATRSFSNFIRQFPGDPRTTEALAKRADSYFSLGDHISALRDYEIVLEKETDPNLISFALQGSARVLRKENKISLMVDRYRRLLTEFRDLPTETSANANYWIGWGCFKEENYKDAAPYLEKAQQLVPEFYNEPAGNLLVLLSFAEADVDRMNKVLKKLLSDFPGKLIPNNMLTWLGLELFHQGNFIDSARFLDRATTTDNPKATDVSIWRSLAKAQNELGQHSAALETAQIVLELETQPRWRADTLLDIAQAQLGLEQYDDALKSAEGGLAINTPGTHTAGLYQVLGKVSYKKGKFKNALAAFETTSSIIIDDPVITPSALFWAALSAEKLGDSEKAVELRKQLSLRFPNWQSPEIGLSE